MSLQITAVVRSMKPLKHSELCAAWHLESNSPIPGDSPQAALTDDEQYKIEAEVVRQTLRVIIPGRCAGFDRGPALANAVLAVLNGLHEGETITQIAKEHGASKSVLREMAYGVRALIGDPLSK